MKPTPLTESIGTNASAADGRVESSPSQRPDAASPNATPHVAVHTVTVRIASTGGFSDSETFSLDGEKDANSFARRVMAASIRAFGRREDAE